MVRIGSDFRPLMVKQNYRRQNRKTSAANSKCQHPNSRETSKAKNQVQKKKTSCLPTLAYACLRLRKLARAVGLGRRPPENAISVRTAPENSRQVPTGSIFFLIRKLAGAIGAGRDCYEELFFGYYRLLWVTIGYRGLPKSAD